MERRENVKTCIYNKCTYIFFPKQLHLAGFSISERGPPWL